MKIRVDKPDIGKEEVEAVMENNEKRLGNSRLKVEEFESIYEIITISLLMHSYF